MELLKFINKYMLNLKPKIVIKPKRGLLKNIPDKLEPYELFYITDIKIFGVADENGVPQFLADVINFDYIEDFPEIGEQNKFYFARIENQLYHYNSIGNKYDVVKLNGKLISL